MASGFTNTDIDSVRNYHDLAGHRYLFTSEYMMQAMAWLHGFGSKRLKTDTNCRIEFNDDPSRRALEIPRRSSLTPSADRIDSVVTTTPTEPSDEDGASSDGQVVESKVRLIPACFRHHGAIRSKDKDQILHGRQQRYNCGRHRACYDAMIVPIVAQPSAYRLTTAFAEEDLKRWVLTPNDTLDGTTEDRHLASLQDPRYTDAMLSSTLDLAVREIQHEIAHINSLVEYAARPPYRRFLCLKRGEAEAEFFAATSPAVMGRAELERTLLDAVALLDYLREKAARFSKMVLELKEEKAKGGNWAEVADLLRMGAVDVEWVDEKCVGAGGD